MQFLKTKGFLFFLFIIFVIVLNQCQTIPAGKDRAKEEVIAKIINPLLKRQDKRNGLRASIVNEPIKRGTRIQSAFTNKSKKPEIIAKNDCYLFFIDKQPGAHFAHPVEYVLFEINTSKIIRVEAEWWPIVNEKPMFETVEKRNDAKTIIFDLQPQKGDATSLKFNSSILSKLIKLHDPCSAWAIIVCGYNDLPDTFDEDTDGMYSVLIGLGLIDNHIFFVSPHTTHPGVDQTTTIANVQWAINQVASQADTTDKVLFFYSSHGGINSLSCVPWSPGGGSISSTDLDNWLDAITCEELTIIMEACHSGSFIGKYASGAYVADEDELTGDGENNRAIFTSASTDTSSYPDIDTAGDPNPGDQGSETIWGYVEAFGVAASDTNGDGEVSFAEAFQYAWDNDITRINGSNTPQMTASGLNITQVYHYCYRVDGSKDLFVCDGPGDVGHNSYDYDSTDIWVTQNPADLEHVDVVSGMNNYVHVAVHNRGTNPISNATLKVYWANTSAAISWPQDFQQIGVTQPINNLSSGDTYTNTWTWYVDPSIGLGHHFCLIAVSDSPEDPLSYPPGITYVAPYDNNIGQKNVTIIDDPGHGNAKFDFIIKNLTDVNANIDLAIDTSGMMGSQASIAFPDDLMKLVTSKRIKLENLSADGRGTILTSAKNGKIGQIPLKPAENRIVRIMLATKKRKPGEQIKLKIRQVMKGTVIGAVTVILRQVSPSDPLWVSRISVEVFSDLAMKIKSENAKEISKLFADLLGQKKIEVEKGIKGLLPRILVLENNVTMELKKITTDDMLKKYLTALVEFRKAIDSGNSVDALTVQGQIAEIGREIVEQIK